MAKSDGTVYINTVIDSSGFSEAFDGYNKDIKDAAAKTIALNRQVADLKVQYKKSGEEVKNLSGELARLTEKQQLMTDLGFAQDSSAFVELKQNIDSVSAALSDAKAKHEETGMSIQALNIRAGMETETLKKLQREARKAAEDTTTLRDKLNSVKNAFGKFGQTIKKMIGKMSEFGKSSKNSGTSLKTMVSAAFGIRTMYAAIRKVTELIKEGMNNLAQYSDETNKDMSALKSSLTQLKNSLATAFAPILSVVTPILTNFMGIISEVASKIGMLMASLTGKGTFTKAIAVQEDYAAGLSDTADAAEDAEKAQKKYFSGLDEIKTFSEDNTSGTATGTVSPSQMFEEVSIDSSISDLASILKEKIGNGDWSGIGALLAEKLNTVFSNIDFASAGANLGEKIKNILSAINGFLQEIDWQMLGNKCAEFVAAIDWNGIVSGISEGIGSALGGLAAFIWGFIEGAWNSVVAWWHDNAYEDGEFTILGLLDGIWEAIKNIGTWIKDNIFTPFIDGFKKAFGINSPSTVMAEMGNYMMQGLFNGITALVDKVVQIFEKIKTKVKTVWNDIKTNTSSVWSTIKTSLTSSWNTLKSNASTFATSVKNAIVNAWNSMKTTITNIWNGIITSIKNSINKIIYVINRMIWGMVNGVNSLIGALNSLSFSFPDWIPGLGGQSFGLNIGYVSAPYIPYLATGAVIPPNAPFMAVLGDQKHGKNIEAPLDTIKQAVREVIGGNGSGNYCFTAQINRRTLFEEFIEEAKLRQSVTGKNPLELA